MAAPRTAVDIERLTRLTGLSAETAVSLLSSSRTRVGLRVLSSTDPPVSLDRLAAEFARIDADTSRATARVALVHVTLPKLEDYGLLEYELRSGTVSLSGPVVGLDEPLETVLAADGESIDSRDVGR